MTIREALPLLKKCPACGSKACMSHITIPEGDFGISVGCPRFCMEDGIHKYNRNSNKEDALRIHYVFSVESAIELWNERVEKWKNKYSDK